MTNIHKDCDLKPLKECSQNQWIIGETNCKHWKRSCFHSHGIFDETGEYVGSADGQWGYCKLLKKKFLYILGTEAPCEKTKQTKLM